MYSFKTRYIGVILWVIISFFVYSCRKDIFQSKTSDSLTQAQRISSVKSDFEAQKLDPKLNVTLMDSIYIKWTPDWAKATEASVNDSTKYIYIPLSGSLSTKANPSVRKLTTINTEKYLMAAVRIKGNTFYMGTYTLSNQTSGSKAIQGVQQPTQNKVYKNNTIPFKSNSVMLSLKTLSTDLSYHFKYTNGFIEKKIKTNNSVKPNYQVCTYYLNCEWINNFPEYCGNNDYYGENGTNVNDENDYDHCYEPPVGIYSSPSTGAPCQPDWTFGGSYITVSDCYEIPDPPPPPPDDQGDNGYDNNTPDPEDPCAKAAILSNSTGFKSNMTKLNDALSNHYETDIILHSDGTAESIDNGPGGKDDKIKLSALSSSTGLLHNHEASHDSITNLSVFSAFDVSAMYQGVNATSQANKAPYIFGLATTSGQYLLSINSLSDFLSFGTNALSDPGSFQAFSHLYNNYVNLSNSAATNEVNLQTLLNLSHSGLQLMKNTGDSTNPIWKKVDHDGNGSLIYTSCP